MGNVQIELNAAGVRELLQSPEMEAVCLQYAQAIAGRAGDGYTVDSRVGRNRVNARVTASSEKARKDNLKNNTLLKAMR